MQRLIQENPDAERAVPPNCGRMVLERLISEARAIAAREGNLASRSTRSPSTKPNKTVARQNQLTLPELRQRVTAEGISLQAFRNDLRDQLLLTRLRGREVDSKRSRSATPKPTSSLQDQRNSGARAIRPC